MTEITDVVVRGLPGAVWWRLSITASRHRGEFEDGHDDTLYAGLIERWGKRIGFLNLAVLRMPHQ